MKHTPGPWKLADALPKAIVQASDKHGEFEENLLWLDTEGYPVFGNPADAVLCATAPDMLEGLEEVAKQPDKAVEIMKREGFVIDNLEDRWQKLAFTFYTMLVESSGNAKALIEKAAEEPEE